MPYIVTSACIGSKDESCLAVCPVDCIHETDSMYVIDPGSCIDCGACEPECPVGAIVPDYAVPPTETRFVAINAVWAAGGSAAVESALARAE